jgi:hypothetical protein
MDYLTACPAGKTHQVARPSHRSPVGTDLLDPEQQRGLEDVTSRMSQQQYAYRSREQVTRFFAGTDLPIVAMYLIALYAN